MARDRTHDLPFPSAETLPTELPGSVSVACLSTTVYLTISAFPAIYALTNVICQVIDTTTMSITIIATTKVKPYLT